VSERRQKKLAGDVAAFLRSYGRKAPRGGEPNDRGYDRELEAKLKRMRPEELDALMRDAVEGDTPEEPVADPDVAPDRRA
jgi:hypothetical protein